MIVYLHGFSSGAASSKGRFFQRRLSDHRFLLLDYPAHRPHAAVALIRSEIERIRREAQEARVILMGSSMGGFYARYLAAEVEAVERTVLINPALQPGLTLAPYVGSNTNMVTGLPFEFTPRDHADMAEYEVEQVRCNKPTLVLLDADDEVIDSQVAAQWYQYSGQVACFSGGSHRFEHTEESVPVIRAFLDCNLGSE